MFTNETDKFYGVDVYGNADTKLRLTMDEELVKSEVIENVIPVFLTDIYEVKEVTIYTLMEELKRLTEFSVARYVIAKWIMAKLRVAWEAGENEI